MVCFEFKLNLGALSILMRQTNVVWLGCASGLIGLDTLSKVFAEAKKTSRRHANPLTISVSMIFFAD